MATIPPPTKLGRYRVLSPRAGLRVSPIQLGAMSLGSHSDQLGKVSKEQAFALLDAYYAAGGNYIDTANSYQGGESEAIIGEWVTARGNRDDLVIATKFTSNYKNGNKDHPIQVNRAGNSLKSIVLSLENSLKRLQTSYVDVLCRWLLGSGELTPQTSTGGTGPRRSRRSCKGSTTSSRRARVGCSWIPALEAS